MAKFTNDPTVARKGGKTINNADSQITRDELVQVVADFKNLSSEFGNLGSKFITLETSIGKTSAKVDGDVKRNTDLVVIGFIVLLFMVAAMMVPFYDYVTSIADSKSDLKLDTANRINEQDLKINNIQNLIDNLKVRNPYLK